MGQERELVNIPVFFGLLLSSTTSVCGTGLINSHEFLIVNMYFLYAYYTIVSTPSISVNTTDFTEMPPGTTGVGKRSYKNTEHLPNLGMLWWCSVCVRLPSHIRMQRARSKCVSCLDNHRK